MADVSKLDPKTTALIPMDCQKGIVARVSGADRIMPAASRAQGITNLVLFGIATSGIVLSTLRQASDMDFRCTVLKDCCFDGDDEVHRVLTEKIFARQANVVTADTFAQELP